MAGGAVGLGALSMLPSAAGFDITSENGLSYYNSSTAEESRFNVDADGVLTTEQIGTESNPISKIESETINANGTITADQIEATGSLRTEESNNVYHTGPLYDGDLGATINSILSDIDRGRIVVDQPDAGTLTWSTDVYVNPNNYPNGLKIEISPGTSVEYDGSDCPLTFNGEGTAGFGKRSPEVDIKGDLDGSNATDPNAAVRIVDYGHISLDLHLSNWTNSSEDCAGVLLKNVDVWTESTEVRGFVQNVDRGFATDVSEVNNGTLSFQDTRIYGFVADSVQSIGFDLNGELNDAALIGPVAMLYQDGAVAFRLNGSQNGMSIVSPESEDFDGAVGNGYRIGPDQVGTLPLIVNGHFGALDGDQVENGTITHIDGGATGGFQNLGAERAESLVLKANGNVVHRDDSGNVVHEFNRDGSIRKTNEIRGGVLLRGGPVMTEESESPSASVVGSRMYTYDNDGTKEVRVKFEDGTEKTIIDNS